MGNSEWMSEQMKPYIYIWLLLRTPLGAENTRTCILSYSKIANLFVRL